MELFLDKEKGGKNNFYRSFWDVIGITGKKLKCGSGNDKENFIHFRKDKNEFVAWENTLKNDAKFNAFVVYDSEKESGNNKFEVTIAGQSLKANVVPEVGFKKIHLGTVNLKKGENNISLKATEIASKELIKLQEVVLEPVK